MECLAALYYSAAEFGDITYLVVHGDVQEGWLRRNYLGHCAGGGQPVHDAAVISNANANPYILTCQWDDAHRLLRRADVGAKVKIGLTATRQGLKVPRWVHG